MAGYLLALGLLASSHAALGAMSEIAPVDGQQSAILGQVTGLHSIRHKGSGLVARVLEADGSASVARDPIALFLVVTNSGTADLQERVWGLPRGVARVSGVSEVACGVDVRVEVDGSGEPAPKRIPRTLHLCFLSPDGKLLPRLQFSDGEVSLDPFRPKSRKRPELTPEGVGAILITSVEEFPAEQRSLIRSASAELVRTGKDPKEFYATVENGREGPKVSLWHQSAFLPENRGKEGNPGGRCFTMYFDREGRVTKSLKWQ